MTSSTDTAIPASIDDVPARLSPAEQACLACLAGHMIPPSEEFAMPGADDPAILADMLHTVRRDKHALSLALNAIDLASGGCLSGLARADQAALLTRLRATEANLFAVVEAVISRAYYRDDRVLKSIVMEERPPFPKGYTVESGDLTLLDPVRQRGAIYRNAE